MPESKIKTLSSPGPSFSPSLIIEQSLDAANDDGSYGPVPTPGDIISGKYRIERMLARGGMGVVYAASHCVSGKKVALKWMLPQLGEIKGARERFIREACATARIAHPNIVDIYDVGAENGCVYLVMEFLRGETLADRLLQARLAPSEAIALLMPALRGVAAAHAHGVVHRDLKPDNIFLCCTEDGDELEPKVLDFGISKITGDEVRSLALTHSGAVLGTPYYMSPEQVRGARDVDARGDVYAFGVILFEALSGRRPFDAETYNELILKIATEEPLRLAELAPQLDPTLIAIIERSMARDPKARIGSVETLALMLEPFADGVRFRNTRPGRDRAAQTGEHALVAGRAPSLPVPYIEQPAGVRRRRLPSALIATACVLLLGVGAGLAIWQMPEALPTLRPHAPSAARNPEPAVVIVPARPPAFEQPRSEMPSETTVNAALQQPARPAQDSNRNQPPTPSARVAARPHPAPPPRRIESEPAPSPQLVAVPAKHAPPRDWDDRLSTDPGRNAASNAMPAGRIDARDFR